MAAQGGNAGGAIHPQQKPEVSGSSAALDALRRSQDQQYLDQARSRAFSSPECEAADPFVTSSAVSQVVNPAQCGGGASSSTVWGGQRCDPQQSNHQYHYHQQQHYSHQYHIRSQQQQHWERARGPSSAGSGHRPFPEQPHLPQPQPPDCLIKGLVAPAVGACDAAEEKDYTHDGWFRKCRGCGAMTVHELMVQSARVPFCNRCKARTAEMVASRRDEGLWQSLLYVHNAWAAAGV